MTPHHETLRSKQKGNKPAIAWAARESFMLRAGAASIIRTLNLNHPLPTASHLGALNGSNRVLNSDGDPIVFKILVFDDFGRDVVSSVMRVNDLREFGITIFLNINAQRQPIPDIAVLYLLEPTAENLSLINADLSKGLYANAYINFLSSIPIQSMEAFGALIIEAGTSEAVAQMYDQYLNFIVSEPDLFSLNLGRETYWSLNSASSSDNEIDKLVDSIVSGLFSVVVTGGSIPIIRCPKGGPAEMIASKIDRKLRDHILNSKDNLFSSHGHGQRPSSSPSSSRPVLVIVDRNVDFVPMLAHGWTYLSLVHDALKPHLGVIKMESFIDAQDPSKGKIKRNYDLGANDFFWARNAAIPFPQVAEDIDIELTKYKIDASEVTRKTGVSSIEDLNETGSSASHLKAAITLLPELRERKAILDMHVNLASALLEQIKDRHLDSFFEIEENITKQNMAQMLELLEDAAKGKEPLDKLRIFIIWFLSTEQEVSRAEMDRFEEALTRSGADITALAYVKRVRDETRMTMMTSAPSAPTQQATDSNLFRGFSSLSNRLTDRLGAGALSSNFENLISNVKTFLPSNKDITITKIVESLMDPASASSSAIAKTEDYLYFDPRSANARGTMPGAPSSRQQNAPGGYAPGVNATFGQRRQGFTEAIVFTVGGGSMDEYGNLQDWAKRTSAVQGAGGPRRRIVYGSTEILNAEEFVGVLAKLGRESG